MSAGTIRRSLELLRDALRDRGSTWDIQTPLASLDELTTERDTYREALERIANMGAVFDAKGTRSRQVCDIARGALGRGES